VAGEDLLSDEGLLPEDGEEPPPPSEDDEPPPPSEDDEPPLGGLLPVEL
jgi:hypothetical protein